MAIKKEIAERMKLLFSKDEIKEFSQAKKPDGTPQDLDLVVNSIPFEEMIKSREEWWKKALSPKSLGGFGMTLEEAWSTIKNHYKMTRKRKKIRSIWDFLKIEYKPHQKLSKRHMFDQAVITKSKIVRDLGPYGKKLSLRHAPRINRRCGFCRGNGTVLNIYHQPQTCPRCGGSGVERQRFI